MLARSFVETDPPFVPAVTVFDQPVFPHHTEAIPPGIVDAGAYRLRFAWTRQDLTAVQALRYRVFNEELGEGLASSAAHGLDADPRDPWFHHLMISHRDTGEVVGTYRLQTAVMAASRHGFYSGSLFELGAVPGAILAEAVEVGRACVDPAHRSGRVLRLLWRGLARYLQWNAKRYLFGCCSLPGTDVDTARDAWRTVHARSALHDRVLVRPRPEVRALPDDGRARPLTTSDAISARLTPLFDGYLDLGAKVCGAPAVDREFGTTDFLVLLDIRELDEKVYRSLFG
jgi:putative hemolysin